MYGNTPRSKEIDGIVYKKCKYCEEYKTLDQFYKNERFYLGCQHYCKICVSVYSKKRNTKDKNRDSTLSKYSLTKEEYQKLYEEQSGRCLICFELNEILHVDHCHITNVIRGLLCRTCNIGLGVFKDNPRLLISASAYLMRKF